MKYQEDWLTETTECFIEYKNLTKSAVDAVQYIQKTPVTAENIKEVINTFAPEMKELRVLKHTFAIPNDWEVDKKLIEGIARARLAELK